MFSKVASGDPRRSESANYDDSGFFSVQVILRALKVWNLTIENINSENMRRAKAAPATQDAFILNLEQHWFTLRRFGGSKDRWYAFYVGMNIF